MPRRTRIKVGGEEQEVLEQDFEIAREEWNEYKLLDGGRIRLKTSVARIFRVLDAEGNPAYNDEGEPLYLVRHKTDVVATE